MIRFRMYRNYFITLARIILATSLATCVAIAPAAQAYAFAYTVADMRLPSAQSGGSACPQADRWNSSLSGGINNRWSTSLSTNPVTILTQDPTLTGKLNEIEAVVAQSFAVWTGVAGTRLRPASLAALVRTATAIACSSSDGLNTICFNQNDAAFTSGVISFTRVTSEDSIGEQSVPNHAPSTFIGEIVDADILLNPTNSAGIFATPAALSANPQANDLESMLTHEMGHFFGFAHTAVWSAMMFPFIPAAGTFDAPRPTPQTPDAPLSDDDRSGLRVLYPNPTDTTHIGTISGRILPANPLSLVGIGNVTGIFAAQVVAIDNATGSVAAATQAGWSCTATGPAIFDGSYTLQKLSAAVSQNYQIYVEPFTGPENSSDVAGALANLCRNGFTDASWPTQFSCTVPAVNTNFTARIRPPG
jgi:hypothetical protein